MAIQVLSINMEDELIEKLESAAVKIGTQPQNIVAAAVEEYLESHGLTSEPVPGGDNLQSELELRRFHIRKH